MDKSTSGTCNLDVPVIRKNCEHIGGTWGEDITCPDGQVAAG